MKLTLNVVHTRYGDHHLFTEGNTLLPQLKELSKLPDLHINLLYNGADTASHCINSELNNIQEYYSQERLSHGQSLQYLLDKTNGWCISIDEDDEFVDNYMEVIQEIIDLLPKLDKTKLYTYKFNWLYISPNSGELHSKEHPLKDCNGDYDMESIAGLSNWNFLIYSFNLNMNGIERPSINQYDDVMWYHALYNLYEGQVNLIDKVVLNYHKERATLSRIPNTQVEDLLEYMLRYESLLLMDIIP